nr:MAG TPA: hypothetical protein [Bacteriophage sp.]
MNSDESINKEEERRKSPHKTRFPMLVITI